MNLANAVAFVKAHYGAILAVLGFLVNDLINGLTAYPKAETALHIFSDLLSFHQNADSPGTFKMIGKRSTNPERMTPLEPKAGAAGVIPFLLAASLLGLSACAGGQAFGKCELGQLPSTVENAIACGVSIATSVQAGTDVQDPLQNCVKDFAPGQGSCIMQAILSWLKGTTPQHGQPSETLMLAISRVQIFLSTHPATSCAGQVRL